MKNEITFQDLIQELKENGIQTSCKGGFKFTEMVHEESQKLIKLSISSSQFELPAKISNLYSEYIKNCVQFEDSSDDILENVTIDIKPQFLVELRRLTLGDVYVNSETNKEYKLKEMTDEDFETKVSPRLIEFNKFGIRLSAPTLAKEMNINNQLVVELQPYRDKKINDSDYGAVADLYQSYEIMKYISEIEVNGMIYDFDKTPKNKKYKLISALPQRVISEIDDFSQQVKLNGDKALIGIDVETGEETEISINSLFTSVDAKRRKK